jgi:hypothetical protein
MTDLTERRLDKAVQEYDENLRFGRNEETGQYCVFRIVRGERPLPILGFTEMPDTDQIFKRLYKSDALRRGNEILDEINKHNAGIEAELESAASDASGMVAEGFEHLFHGVGKTPYRRVYGTNYTKTGGYS